MAVETDEALSVVAPGGKLLAEPDVDGLVKLPKNLIASLSKLGLELKESGVVQIDNSFAFITKKAMHTAITKLEEMIPDADGETIHDIASSLAKLARVMPGLAGKNFGVEAETDKPPAPRRSFAAGQTVHFHQHVHQAPTKS